uniref:Hypothetical chloroplast RF1 n=1 Tax=Pseudochlorella signiensis TaxID=173497 RepID=A0A097KL12_9CHLO|nr:hypothetical chloroplast RF1 [Pseudochlorella signiensis]AIT93866.1 hypothetical chloroplast RF1 [Pseudochlorella signiensis]
MSFVTAIKDYIDVLNHVYDSVGNVTIQQIFQQTFVYIFSSIKFLAGYLVSFQWLRDLAYLPILVPEISTTILKGNYFLDAPLSNFFTLLETPTYENNKFLIGFLNSFFLCLPLSTTHFISIRRLLVQGIPAGIVSNIGTILGYTFFIFSVLFGLRLVIIPWLAYEPFSYIIGVLFTLTIVYDMTHERTIRKFDWSQKSTLIQIFFINFLLTWTEQSCIFSYFGNLTLNPQPTIFDNFSSLTKSGSILAHSTYLIGILLGSVFFTSLFTLICLQLSNLSLKLSAVPYSRWLRRTNFVLLTTIIAFTFASIPFYSLDYLFGGPLGFISQDKAFDKTILSSKNVEDSTRMLGENSNFKSLGTDVTPFDRGSYLLPDSNENFEDLNYQGEYAWTARKDHRAVYGTEKSRKLFSNFFKKTAQNLSQKQDEIQNPISSQNRYSAPKEKNSPLADRSSEQKSFDLKNKEKLNQLDSNSDLIEKSDSEKIVGQNEVNTNEFPDNLSDFETDDLYGTSQKGIPSSYFYKLNHRINTDFKINQSLQPLLDTSFSPQFFGETLNTLDPELEKTLKQRYYSNPVYKTLLSADIDLFLRRQPSSYLLSPKEEKNLFQKRLMLSNYYDSLRYYQKMPYTKEFQNFFSGSKSYADRVYNQQFKGTLKVVRRLFSITFNEEENLPEKITLKFDQPLYKKLKQNNNLIGHEELVVNKKNKPFIELVNPIPFYTGWDEQLRKLVITNRLLPRSTAGYNMQFDSKKELTDYPTLSELLKSTKKVDFTTWPLTKTNLEKPKEDLKIPYNVLYEQISDPQNKLLAESLKDLEGSPWTFETVPPNLKKIDPDKINDVLPPTRGGFVWSGHSSLKINFKKIFKEGINKFYTFKMPFSQS